MRRTKSGILVLFVLTVLCLLPSTAFAQGKEKAGRWMFNIRIGAAANVGAGSFGCARGARFDYHCAQFVASPEIAVGLDSKYHAYLGIIPMFQVGDGFSIINVPLTFQYDIELPVKGLYIYPKVNSGYSRWLEPRDANYFNIEPAVGIKYQFHRHVHVGGEPLGFMFYVGDNNGSDFNAQYHFLAYIGFDV